MLLADKYRPKSTKQMIGADYAAMSVLTFLRPGKKQFRAVLLSGPPGVGKSLLAELACAESGLTNVIRADSSRKRTKKALDEVQEAFLSRRIDAYVTGKMQRSKPGAVIVDDLDAMVSGGADRGGVSQICSFIKKSHIPVICVCNDPNSRGLKPLVTLCMHVRMQRPPAEAIARMLCEVAKSESIPLTMQSARDVARLCGCDVRASLHELQFCASRSAEMVGAGAKMSGEGIVLDRTHNPFEIVGAIFSKPEKSLVAEGSKLYDSDSMLGPMLLHENYAKANACGKDISAMVSMSDAFSFGDTVERLGVSADVKAFATCALPCVPARSGGISGRIEFPVQLGKGSTRGKNERLCHELSLAIGKGVSCYPRSFAAEVLPCMRALYVEPMSGTAVDGPKRVATVLKEGGMTKADWDSVVELCGPFAPAVSAAKRTVLAREMATKKKGNKKKKRAAEEEKGGDAKKIKLEEEEEEEEEEEDEEKEEKACEY